jgi:tRNA threonylcarbamoyladenosine biosynthesis protein TsaE
MTDFPEIIDSDFAASRLSLISRSENETIHFGGLLAKNLQPGDIISLDGSLGAGKTTLTRGIAAGLGCKGAVSSPTFTLLVEHPANAGGTALYHFDAYRLGSGADFIDAGLDEYFDGNGICVVEWGSRIVGILPRRTLVINLHQADPDRPDERRINLAWPDRPGRLVRLSRLAGEIMTGRRSEKGCNLC